MSDENKKVKSEEKITQIIVDPKDVTNNPIKIRTGEHIQIILQSFDFEKSE